MSLFQTPTLVTQIVLNSFVGAAAGDMDLRRTNADRLCFIIAGSLCGDSHIDAAVIQRNIEKFIVDAEKSALLGNAFVCNHYGLAR